MASIEVSDVEWQMGFSTKLVVLVLTGSMLPAGIAQAQSNEVTPPTVILAKPFKAGSWGGVVRAGPGPTFKRLDSLKEGEPVVVVGDSRVMRDGYPWFKIRYRGQKTGFQWGGILCATDREREGLFQMCKPAAAEEDDQDSDIVGPVSYVCDGDTPMVVTYDNRNNTSVASITHNATLKLKLPQARSGSGARYSNGKFTLHTKGTSAIFSWPGNQQKCEEK